MNPPRRITTALASALLLSLAPIGVFAATQSNTAKNRPDSLASRKTWWSLQPIANTPPPRVKNAAWSAHPVDRFILARLESGGLQPAPPADARTLLRRLSFALTGLPPTPADAAAFEVEFKRDPQAAIGAAADRLLASPAFGERWARHWMDLARYAETFGSEHDYLNPHAWRYRDWTIRAFNADLPYDRFVQEQIAGDLLEARWNRDLGLNESLLATAWHRMIESYATPVDVKREEATVIEWQIEALGKSFLGLTLNCARCHDHKFDAVSAADYHALYGVFASTRPVMTILDDPAKLTANDAELARLKNELRPALAATWREQLEPAAFEAALRRTGTNSPKFLRDLAAAADFAVAWSALRTKLCDAAAAESRFKRFADFSRGDLDGWRVGGPGLPTSALAAGMLSLDGSSSAVRAIQPSGFFSDAISERHGGSLRSPEFVITNDAVSVLASGTGRARLRLVIENFQNDLLLFKGVNPDLDSAAPKWFTMRIKEQWLGRRARVELMTRDDKTCVGHTKDQIEWSRTDGRSTFGIQRVVLHDGEAPPAPPALPASALKWEPKSFAAFAAHLAPLAVAVLDSWSEQHATDEQARLLQALLDAGAISAKPPAGSQAAVLLVQFAEVERAVPLPTRAPGVVEDGYGADSPLFPRGDHLKPGAAMPRRFLEALGGAPLGARDSGRLALAREITRRDNPLTARVMANRVWMHLVGRGLVATPDDFGRMGEAPTHPELLDHLASQFMADGWSVKKLIRHVVTSRAWQLAAEPPPRADERDPENKLLSHANVRRLDAEALRDAMLAVGGNLKPGHTGPGVRVFYRTQIDPDKQPAAGLVDGGGVRSVYLESRRLFPSEWLAAFDAPKPNILTGRRSLTNVPGQTLALMNDPFVQHQAKRLAGRTASTPDDAARFALMHELAFARKPTAAETERALAFVRGCGEGSDGWRDLAHALLQKKEFSHVR
jgi:hypothetical protein